MAELQSHALAIQSPNSSRLQNSKNGNGRIIPSSPFITLFKAHYMVKRSHAYALEGVKGCGDCGLNKLGLD